MLTDKQIRGLKPADREYIVSDDVRSRGVGRLILCVRPSGSKTWEYRYFVNGKRRKKALGAYPTVSLAQARSEVQRLAESRSAGKVGRGPAEDQRALPTGSLSDLLGAYIEDMRFRKCTSADDVEKMFSTYIEKTNPLLWEKRADLVTPGDISDLLAVHLLRGVTTGVNRLRSYISAAYQFGLRSEYNPRQRGRAWGLTYNPAAVVPAQGEFERAGKRTLTDKEVWHAWHNLPRTRGVGWLTTCAIRLAIATGGQRPTMLLRLKRDAGMIDLENMLLAFPDDTVKTDVPHVVPLSERAAEVIRMLLTLTEGRSEQGWLFASPNQRGDGPITIEAVCSAVEYYREHWKTRHWTLRDIRRTGKTVLSRKKVPKEFRNRFHGHALTDIDDKHYDMYDYLDEKREALAVWDAYLDEVLATPAPDGGDTGTKVRLTVDVDSDSRQDGMREVTPE